MKTNRIIKLFIFVFIMIFINSCNTVKSKHGTVVDKGKKYLKQAARQNYKIARGIDVSDEVLENLLPNLDLNLADNKNSVKNPINKFNISANQIPARDFFLSLVEGTNQNIIVHPDIAGNISLTLKNVTIENVLNMTNKLYGYDFEKTPTGYQIFAANLRTKIFHVNYLDMIRTGSSDTRVSSSSLDNASNSSSSTDTDNTSTDSSDSSSLNSKITTTTKADFWEQIRTSLEILIGEGEGRSVAVNPMAGIVIVQAMPDELRKVGEYLHASEKSLGRQVILEAKILEVELSDQFRSGINWALINKNIRAANIAGHDSSLDSAVSALPSSIDSFTTEAVSGGGNQELSDLIARNVSLDGSSPSTILDSVIGTAKAFGGVFSLGLNYNRLATFVELLGAQGNVQVLSSPRVATTNNQKAIIKVGVDKFFVTNVSSSNTSSGTTSDSTTTTTPSLEFDSFFSGVALDVTPQIKEDGTITLHIHPTISSVEQENVTIKLGTGGDQVFPLAKSSIRESDNIVKTKNGQIIVIGGLMQDKMAEKIVGVPGLKDLPFLGSMFRNTVQQSTKSELVILLRTTLMDDDEWVREAEDTYTKFEEMDQGFHMGGNINRYGNLGEMQEYR